MFGRHPLLPLDHTPRKFQFNRPNYYWHTMVKCMNIYSEVAGQHIRLRQQQTKGRFDPNRVDTKYEVNDLVFWKIPGIRGKFQERFSGPYIIVKKQHLSYTIKDTHSLTLKHVNVRDLKSVYLRCWICIQLK